MRRIRFRSHTDQKVDTRMRVWNFPNKDRPRLATIREHFKRYSDRTDSFESLDRPMNSTNERCKKEQDQEMASTTFDDKYLVKVTSCLSIVLTVKCYLKRNYRGKLRRTKTKLASTNKVQFNNCSKIGYWLEIESQVRIVDSLTGY